MKVKLQCIFGDNLPGDVVDLKKDVAEKLIADGLAVDTKEEPAGDSKELKAQVKALQSQVDALTGENEMLKAELEGLKNGASNPTK